MVQTIEELQDAHVEPDVWKIEGLDRTERIASAMWRRLATAVATKSVASFWAAGEDDKNVREWLTTAATVPGFIGFAVGRTDFWEPLVGWREKRTTREAAVAEVARRYREFVDIFEKARAKSPGPESDGFSRRTMPEQRILFAQIRTLPNRSW